MSLLTNAQNTLIQGATFNAIVHGDVHHHSGSQLSVIRRTQRGFEILQRHVDQAAFHDSLERTDPPRCHPLTRHAILDRIMNWISDPDNLELFIWIFGPAGGGKTAIAQTIAEMCAAAGNLAASFFFSRTVAGRKDFNQLVPTLAYQLALNIPEIREDISHAIEHDPAIFSRNLATQMQVLIVQPLNAAVNDPFKKEAMEKRKNVVVLDGFDECGDGRSQREVLEVLSAQVKLVEVPVIFLITSRPEQQIRVAFSKPELDSQTLAIALDENLNPDDDIQVFLEEKFRELKMNHPSGFQLLDQWPSEDDIRQIVRKSSGQFIYAATVMKFMDCHRHPPVKRLKIILGAAAPSNKDSPYAELDALYQQLFLAIDDLEGAMDLLTLLVLQDRDSYYLTVDFSENLLGYDQGEVLAMLSDMHAFVHVPKPDDLYDAIRIHHASLPDFLFDRSRSGEFFIDSRNGHANITTHWIKFVQRSPLPDLGAHTVVRPRGHSSVIITAERIIEHCTQSHLTDELCKALSIFNLEAHLILYPGSAFKELIQSLSSFLQWLKPETPELNDTKLELYHYHMTHIDHWILNQLSLFPDDMRSTLSAAFIFEDKFSSSPGALFDILSHKFDPITNSFLKIEYSTANKDFWFTCQEFGGVLLFDIFKGFFTDSSRSSTYVVHERAYAELACIFLDHIRLAPEGNEFAEPWSQHRYNYVPNGNRYRINRTEGTDEVLIRAALEFLPSVLSRSPQNAELAQGLKEHALQLKSTDSLHEKRLGAAIAGFEYLKKVESALDDHLHKPDYNVCIVCLLQPGAIPVPAPFSWSSLDQAVVPQGEVEVTAESVTFTGHLDLRLRRWIPPMRNDSELEETATSSWMFQSDADFQQMVEGADLPQMVEGADLQQAVPRTTEPVTLAELYMKWTKREDSGINERSTRPSANPGVQHSSNRPDPFAPVPGWGAWVDPRRVDRESWNGYSSSSRHPADRVDKSYGLFGSDSEDSDSSGVWSKGDHKIPSLAAPIPIRPSLGTYHVSSDPSDLSKSKSQGPWVAEPSGYKSARSSTQHRSSSHQDPWGRNQDSWGRGQDFWSGGQDSWGRGQDSRSGDQVSWSRGQDSWSGDQDSWGRGQDSWGGEEVSWGGDEDSWGRGQDSWGGEEVSWGGDEDSWGRGQDPWDRGADTVRSEVGGGLSGVSKAMAQQPWVGGQPADPLVQHSSNRPYPHPSQSMPIPMVQGHYEYFHDREGSSRGDRERSKGDKYSRTRPKDIFKPYSSSNRHPALQDDSQLHETATPNAFSTSDSLLNPKRVNFTAEPVVPSKSHPRSIPATQNETATPTEFSMGSPSRKFDSKEAVEAAAEPIFLTKANPRLIPAMPQLDETATLNSFSTSSPPLDPKPLAIVTAGPVTLTDPHPRSIPATQNGTAAPTVFSQSSSQRTVDSKPAVEAADELLILTKPHPKLILATQEDSRLDEMGTHNVFSKSSFDGAVDPKRLMEPTAEPVTLTEPHPSLTPATQDTPNAFSSLPGAVDPERMVEVADDLLNLAHPNPKLILAMPEDSQLNETATLNVFSMSSPPLDPKRLVETTAELLNLTEPHPTLTPATQDETETSNAFFSLRGAVDPERVVEVAAEPVLLTKPHPKLILAMHEDPQLDKTTTPNAFSTSSPGLLDPRRVVEAESVTLTEPHPTLTPATQDKPETPNPFSSPHEATDPGEQVVEVADEPATRIDPVHPTPRLVLPTLKLDAELHEMGVPNIRLARTSTLLLGLVIVTITLVTLHQNWARTSHL